MDLLISLALTEFVQVFCAKFFDGLNQTRAGEREGLLFDRLMHELTAWLDENSFDSTSLLRVRQVIAILLTGSREEAQELVEEWKLEGNCKLRAGEILLILSSSNK